VCEKLPPSENCPKQIPRTLFPFAVSSSIIQGLYRPWKVLEFYCSEFQALESPGKRHRSWKTLESPGILKQHFWIFLFVV